MYFNMEKYQALIPLLYLVVIALINVVFYFTGVPKEIGLLVTGAGLTRVKVGGNVKTPAEPPTA